MGFITLLHFSFKKPHDLGLRRVRTKYYHTTLVFFKKFSPNAVVSASKQIVIGYK